MSGSHPFVSAPYPAVQSTRNGKRKRHAATPQASIDPEQPRRVEPPRIDNPSSKFESRARSVSGSGQPSSSVCPARGQRSLISAPDMLELAWASEAVEPLHSLGAFGR
eukprot:scaffold3350_cov268-Pinguiococcus_pyrenoidosus.AAC.34